MEGHELHEQTGALCLEQIPAQLPSMQHPGAPRLQVRATVKHQLNSHWI